MKYLILEQKYFELIEDNQPMDALYCLRNEIRPLNIRIERTHQLTAYDMKIERFELKFSFSLGFSCSILSKTCVKQLVGVAKVLHQEKV